MQYLRRGSSQGVQGQQQHLEDLEEILNTPAPALNHELSSSVSEGSQRHALIGRSISEPNLQSIGQPHTVPVCQSAAGNSLDEQAKDCHRALAHDSQDSADPKSRTSKVHQQLLAWQSRAYRTARAPLAAIRSQAVPERRSQMQENQGTWLPARPQIPNLMEHLISNKGAAIAASVAGGAAGGAIAGPFGVAAGAKTGAFMIAVGAAAAGAAQQYYMPVKAADANPAGS